MASDFARRLLTCTNYTMDTNIITSTNIYEYDISKANINILYLYDKISTELFLQLYNSPKQYREVMIGKMIAEDNGNDFNNIIHNGILEARKRLIKANNIKPMSIVRIANDAIYVMGYQPLKHTRFRLSEDNEHEIVFKLKNVFSTFIQFHNKVVLFFSILPDDNFNIDVKGIDQYTAINLHQPMLGLIGEILFYKERAGTDIAVRKFIEFFEKYVNLELDMGYYREFNANSCYKIKTNTRSNLIMNYGIMDGMGLTVSDLDISYNLNILRELYSMILS